MSGGTDGSEVLEESMGFGSEAREVSISTVGVAIVKIHTLTFISLSILHFQCYEWCDESAHPGAVAYTNSKVRFPHAIVKVLPFSSLIDVRKSN